MYRRASYSRTKNQLVASPRRVVCPASPVGGQRLCPHAMLWAGSNKENSYSWEYFLH